MTNRGSIGRVATNGRHAGQMGGAGQFVVRPTGHGVEGWATGRLPFEAETTWALVAKHLEERAPDPRTLNPEVSVELSKVILKAMAKSPQDRYQTAAELHDALG